MSHFSSARKLARYASYAWLKTHEPYLNMLWKLLTGANWSEQCTVYIIQKQLKGAEASNKKNGHWEPFIRTI
jgi:hypothetical protein